MNKPESAARDTQASTRSKELFEDPHGLHIFLVGVLHWKNREIFRPFPRKGRADLRLARRFSHLGIPEKQIHYLKDEAATLHEIHRRFEAILAETTPGDTLVLYYCGHGVLGDHGETYFANHDANQNLKDTAWSLSSIFETINRNFKGSRALLFADCCHSGTLSVLTQTQKGNVGFGSLTSTRAESSSSGNWTFTEALLLALEGNAMLDRGAKGFITLDDLAHFTALDMALFERQHATFATGDPLNPNLVLCSTRTRLQPRAGERVEVLWDDKWLPARVLNKRKSRVRVHFIGFSRNQDEWVSTRRIRPLRPFIYPEGTPVEVQWNGLWTNAIIMDIREGLHYIQFRESSRDRNEWVAPHRLRLPR